MGAGFGCPDDVGAGQSLCLELLRIALEEQQGSMERDKLSGTVTPKAGRVLAVPGLSCPHPFSHLILVPSLSLSLLAARRSSKYFTCFFWPIALYLLL